MAYRHQTIKAICKTPTCPETAVSRCRRCGAPFCASHAPLAGHRCESCEHHFQQGRNLAVLSLALFELGAVIALAVLLNEVELSVVPPLVTALVLLLLFGGVPLFFAPLRRAFFLFSRKRAIDE